MRRVVLGVALCGAAGCGGAPVSDGTVTVFAAASLAGALGEIVGAFEGAHSTRVRVNLAGSGALAHQIAEGADADLFVSADTAWADWLAARGVGVERRDAFANRLVLIVPEGGSAPVASLEDLVRVERFAMGDPAYVPAGTYAREALLRAGVWSGVRDKAVNTMDVRQALLYVQRGEVDAGIVYRSDTIGSKGIRVVSTIASDRHEAIRYAVVLLDGRAEARAFYAFLESDTARAILARYGFDVRGSAVASLR